MNTFKLKIIASNKIFFDGDAQSLVVPNIDKGLEGFLANHENCIMPVETGEMKITDADGKVVEAFVGNGFLEFLDNTAMLVCISAELPEEIDERRAQEAKDRAEEELRQQRSQLEYYHSQANLARAMERLKIKNRHNI
ncbi:MAG: F0F1 ATP synthase subunit epsilon [Eubacterium sp.]|nr:F0F1 ATP synthase subunit epsilon [Eubacterium sp.]